MPTPEALAASVLQMAAALAAAYGTWVCIRLQRYGRDRRLVALAWFFGLFAASVALHAAWEWQIGSLPPPAGAGAGPGGFQPQQVQPGPGGPRPLFRPAGDENVTLWLVGHHLLMLASLGVGVVAFGRRHASGTTPAVLAVPALLAAIGLAWVSDLVPLMLGIEAGLTLYLAIQALLNHLERRSPGALQVAAGFALFFLGHLLFFLRHQAGQGRTGIGDILAVVGIVLLVQVLPTPPRARNLEG